MALRAGLKLKLRRAAKKLDLLASKERNINTPVGWEERWFTWRVFRFRYRRVVKPCRLLRLPVELLLQILEYLQTADHVQLSNHRYPLLSLRLTCKEMYHLVTPLLYRAIDLNTVPGLSANDRDFMDGSLTRIQKLALHVQIVGSHIRKASIRVLKPDLWSRAQDVDTAIVGIFTGSPQLRDLTLICDLSDIEPSHHSSLVGAVSHLTALTHITIKEAELLKGVPAREVQFEDCGAHIANRLLAAILKYHGRNLRSVKLYGYLTFDPLIFEQFRDDTPHLETLDMRMSLTFQFNSLFREPKPWSCAATLQSLSIIQCRVDAEDIATHLAIGTFGSLRRCSVFSCGYSEDGVNPRPTSTWKSQPLETFRLHHFMGWEVDALSIISTQVLIATQIERERFTSLIWNPKAFPGVEQIRVSSVWMDDEYLDLLDAAASRDIEVIKDWNRYEDPLADEFGLLDRCHCSDCRDERLRL